MCETCEGMELKLLSLAQDRLSRGAIDKQVQMSEICKPGTLFEVSEGYASFYRDQ